MTVLRTRGMAKRQNQHFKGGKGLVVYIGQSSHGSANPLIIEYCRHTWNEVQVDWLQKIKKTVKRISIQRRANSSIKAGTWKDSTQTLEIIDTGYCHPDFFRGVILHEMAHAYYDKQTRLSYESIQKFREIVTELEPVNEYTRKNRDKWGVFLYANEIHSAIVEHLYTNNKATLGSSENLDKLIQAYNQLHSEID